MPHLTTGKSGKCIYKPVQGLPTIISNYIHHLNVCAYLPVSLSVCVRSSTLSTSAPLCIYLINLSLCLPVDLGACLSVVYHALCLPVCYFLSLPFLLARLAFFVRVLCAYLNLYLTVYQNFSKSVKV